MRPPNNPILSQVLAHQLSSLESLSPTVVLVLVCVVSSALSQVIITSIIVIIIIVIITSIIIIIIIILPQVASNSTIVTIMVPVVFAVSESLHTNPLYLALGKIDNP